MVEYIKQRIDINGLVDWSTLSYALDYIDTLVLKLIYYPRQATLTFKEILNDLNRGKIEPIISKYALRKKLINLEKDLILKLVRSKPLIIWPITELSEKNVKLLLKNLSVLHRLEKIE